MTPLRFSLIVGLQDEGKVHVRHLKPEDMLGTGVMAIVAHSS